MLIRALMDELLRWLRDLSATGAHRRLAISGGLRNAITTVHVSDRGHAGFVTLAAEDYQLAALGQVVELHMSGNGCLHCCVKHLA
ncbi:2-octaprenyl-6-methoxyphenol hydroxylase [Escherichia coli]|nr:2-octaprenyl-6-methoxyphenol hydroxylase [Escherichia coli]